MAMSYTYAFSCAVYTYIHTYNDFISQTLLALLPTIYTSLILKNRVMITNKQ